jgi:hypothetical protein
MFRKGKKCSYNIEPSLLTSITNANAANFAGDATFQPFATLGRFAPIYKVAALKMQ